MLLFYCTSVIYNILLSVTQYVKKRPLLYIALIPWTNGVWFIQDGTFLVRVSEKDPKFPYTLAVLNKGHVNNLRIRKRTDGKFALGDEKPDELVSHLCFSFSLLRRGREMGVGAGVGGGGGG